MSRSITARALIGSDLTPTTLTWEGDTITEVAPGAAHTSHIVAPGLIDIQVNGGWGNDFTTHPETIWEVGRMLPKTGVTTFVPTIISAPYETAAAAIGVLRKGPPEGYRGATAVGLHIEGPWISPDFHGAHDPSNLRPPDPEVARHWVESGVVTMVTLAPELDGADQVAAILAAGGVRVSAGHTGADYETGSAALSGHWSAVTHLYNQMTPLHHRHPGMVAAALMSDRPCGMIIDGVHSHPGAIELAWRHLGLDRLVLMTDAIALAGSSETTGRLGDDDVAVDGGAPRNRAGTLAGSLLTMPEAVRNLERWSGADLAESLACATATPARAVGVTDRGLITPGRRADLVVLNDDLTTGETIIAGETVYRSA